MTNEQLAVLLGSYLERLRAILENIEATFPDGADRISEWWREEKRVHSIFTWKDREALESEGCELRPTGGLLALEDLKEFISGLQQDVHDLNPCKRT